MVPGIEIKFSSKIFLLLLTLCDQVSLRSAFLTWCWVAWVDAVSFAFGVGTAADGVIIVG